MIIFKKMIGITILASLVGLSPAAGQGEPNQRLIVVCADAVHDVFPSFGDICSWAPGEDDLTRETTGYAISELALSPDGTHVVYLALPDEYVAALQRGADPTNATAVAHVGSEPSPTNIFLSARAVGWYPTNVGLIDLTVPPSDPGRFTTIAEQMLPANAGEYAFQRRSLPVWSPDSTRVAWVELNLDTEAADGRIMMYDTRTDTLSPVAASVSLGYLDGGELHIPRLVGWGSLIAHRTSDAGVYPDRIAPVLSLFDENAMQNWVPVGFFADYEDRLTNIRWVQHRDAWVLAMNYLNSGWVVLDPLENTYEKLAHPPFMQAATGVGLTGIISGPTDYPQTTTWQGEGMASGVPMSGLPVTFDPAGHPIWLDDEGILIVLQAEGPLPLPLGDAMRITAAVWTPVVWLTDGAGTPTVPEKLDRRE